MISVLSDEKKLILKKPFEILLQAQVAQILFNFLLKLRQPLPVGTSENQIQFAALDFFHRHGCEPALKGYRNFPAHVSVSRNNVLAHGVPSEYKLQNDDIVTVDLVGKIQNWHADLSWTYVVGKSDELTKYLQVAAWKVSRRGVQAARPGNTLNDIAYEILDEAEKQEVYVHRDFTGHGIGRDIHELPIVYYEMQKQNIPLLPGMVICIEPIVSLKKQSAILKPDGSYVGSENEKSAVYEHMVGIFSSESRILSSSLVPVDNLPALPF